MFNGLRFQRSKMLDAGKIDEDVWFCRGCRVAGCNQFIPVGKVGLYEVRRKWKAVSPADQREVGASIDKFLAYEAAYSASAASEDYALSSKRHPGVPPRAE